MGIAATIATIRHTGGVGSYQLEGQTHSELEGKVISYQWPAVRVLNIKFVVPPFKVVDTHPPVVANPGRVLHFICKVEPYEEIIEVKTNTGAGTNGNITPETVQSKFALRIFHDIFQVPDVAHIGKKCAIHFYSSNSGYGKTVLKIDLQLDITKAFPKARTGIAGQGRAEPELTKCPGAHTVWTTGS